MLQVQIQHRSVYDGILLLPCFLREFIYFFRGHRHWDPQEEQTCVATNEKSIVCLVDAIEAEHRLSFFHKTRTQTQAVWLRTEEDAARTKSQNQYEARGFEMCALCVFLL